MAIDDTALYIICDRVANGESLTVMAAEFGMTYTKILSSIRSLPDGEKAYAKALADRDEWVKERILAEIRFLSMLDITKLYDDDGHPLPMGEWPEGMGRAVQFVKTNKLYDGYGKEREEIGTVTDIKLWNKEKSLELIGKNLHLFTERVDITGKMTLEDLIDKTINRG